MVLAIHSGKDKLVSWNTLWMDYCRKNSIPFIGVDCYSYDIIEVLRREKVTHLMWAFSLAIPKDHIVAKTVLNAANAMGIKTFPNFASSWHFEDKIAQKYLLEAIGAPIVKSWTFFDKDKALVFSRTSSYPLVAKLRKGAGSKNVVLLKDEHSARHYIMRMFSKGYKPVQKTTSVIKDRLKSSKGGNGFKLRSVFKKFIHYRNNRNLFNKEIGYVYFQEFLHGNTNDLRIAVVGNRIWGFYRGVRKDDFRASGSGIIDYDTPIPLDMIKLSYDITKQLGSQSLCFDYVKSPDGSYRIVEICYGYVSEAIFKCNGYWDNELQFHQSHIMPDECILSDFIKS